MIHFQFFKNIIIDEQPNRPLLPNEQIVYFYDSGYLHARTIAWREYVHLNRTRFRRRDFIGTMSEFFSDKLFMPPIEFIETTYGHHMSKELNGVGVEPRYVFSYDTQVIIHWYEAL